MLICFFKCNLFFQSVLISLVLNAENIKMSHMQQWFYRNSSFQIEVLDKPIMLNCGQIMLSKSENLIA